MSVDWEVRDLYSVSGINLAAVACSNGTNSVY